MLCPGLYAPEGEEDGEVTKDKQPKSKVLVVSYLVTHLLLFLLPQDTNIPVDDQRVLNLEGKSPAQLLQEYQLFVCMMAVIMFLPS